MGAEQSQHPSSAEGSEWVLVVLKHCPWSIRGAAMAVSKEWGDVCFSKDFYYKFLCERLAEEHLLYVPSAQQGAYPPRGVAATWKELFADLFPQRVRWLAPASPPTLISEAARLLRDHRSGKVEGGNEIINTVDDAEEHEALIAQARSQEIEEFRIGVYVRFRGQQQAVEEDELTLVKVPLHQKVQIVRDKHGVGRREAMDIIMSQRGKEILEDPWSNADVRQKAQAPAAEEVDKENLARNGNGAGGGYPPAENEKKAALLEAQQAAPLTSVTVAASEAQVSDSAAAMTVEEVVEVEEGEALQEAEAKADAADARAAILNVDPQAGSVLAMAPGVGLRDFSLDGAFTERYTQELVYEDCARRMVMDVLNGRNGSLICYGQTASGKTYTMFGPPESMRALEGGGLLDSSAGDSAEGGSNAPLVVEALGMVPRACRELLEALEKRKRVGLESELMVSYVEVFGSEITDLLAEGRIVGQDVEGRYAASRATDRVGHRYVLDGHSAVQVHSWSQIQELLEQGDSQKRRAATAMNERSTRAHTLFVLTLRQSLRDKKTGVLTGQELSSKLFLADLGGSERITRSKTDAATKAPVVVVGGVEQSRVTWEEYYRSRQRVQETLLINQGLFALKKVIETLHERQVLQAEGKTRLPYVPYQDSKLTMVLQDALGGNSRTTVITTASMDPRNAVESVQTLRFAERCAAVRTRRADRAAAVALALRQLEAEIKRLETQIEEKERWEERRVLRKDERRAEGEALTGEEVIVTSVLAGAEKERALLEVMLQRQRDLEGLGSELGGKLQKAAEEASDGGKGEDFRSAARFSAKMKARDFEEPAVLADALRFVFRKVPTAFAEFGETEETVKKRLPKAEIPKAYFDLAARLKVEFEDRMAAGLETGAGGFGKKMMDACRDWAKGKDVQAKDAALRCLLERLPDAPDEEGHDEVWGNMDDNDPDEI